VIFQVMGENSIVFTKGKNSTFFFKPDFFKKIEKLV